MIKRHHIVLSLLILPLCLLAQEPEYISSSQLKAAKKAEQKDTQKDTQTKDGRKILTGMSGGMAVHAGYSFAQSPDELFRNASLATLTDLSKDGVTFGLGGALRLHLLNHFHLGGEGYVSSMPLSKSGSNIRMGFGGAILGGYFTIGKFIPLLGVSVGGGVTSRTYVPQENVEAHTDETDEAIYNSSFVKTPFFLIDPYVGFEVAMTKNIHLLIKVDYPLPFGSQNKGIGEMLQWSSYVSPSGPRLHVGAMFGH